MFFRNEGWLDPVPHTHAMLSAAIRTGAALHTGSRVIETRIECGRVVQVKTASGATFNTEVAVRYAGRWVSDVARLAGVTIPLAPTVGLLVTTTPAPTCLRRIVLVPDCDLRPDGAGRLRLHMEDTDADASAGSRPRSPGRPGAAGVRRSQGGSGQKRHTTNAGRPSLGGRADSGCRRILCGGDAQRSDTGRLPRPSGGRGDRAWPCRRSPDALPTGEVLCGVGGTAIRSQP